VDAAVKRMHPMRFGAQYRREATSFRLWAPAARHVDLVLDAGDTRELAMQRADDGFCERIVDGVAPGAGYAFRIDGRIEVPDPASRANPGGVHAKSVVVDPCAYAWRDEGWRGRAWHEAVVYELHVGTFTPQGTFGAAIERLDALAGLGVTAVELMPVAAFGGTRNWGYDGVLPFAPAACYGSPDDLKRLVDEAHARHLMMLLDVVYNHFGPDGNYLHEYAPQFFDARHATPWGPAINFDGDGSRIVRDFFIENALYWLEEFHFDGLRLDAVHAIVDDSKPDFVSELAMRVHERADGRELHLVLENDRNEARYLRRDAQGRPILATAQWNDDVHHALHLIATGETDGYYGDYAAAPVREFARGLAEGFVFQGQPSPYRGGRARGEPSRALPPVAFVAFAQDHDQVGNRAFGERLVSLAEPALLRALVSCLLLSPQVPMLFMGEEFGASTPFLYFCDFAGDLATAVTEGRRREFARFGRFRDPSAREAIPDPNAPATFANSKLDWDEARTPEGEAWRSFYRRCLAIRHRHVVPLLRGLREGGSFAVDAEALIRVNWTTESGVRLHLVANLSAAPATTTMPRGEVIYASGDVPAPGTSGVVAPGAVSFVVEGGDER
jgi:malto-oligosyltrehalose trehalohydrolase